MSDTRPPREVFPVRLDRAVLLEVKALADRETEGNVSQMIRKLINKGLEASAVHPVGIRNPTAVGDEIENEALHHKLAYPPSVEPSVVDRAPAEQARRQSATRKPVRKAPTASEPQEGVPAGKPMSKVEAQKAQREARYR